MKVDTMRAIDRWAGIPLTLLATGLLALLSLFGSTQRVRPKRVLLVELSEMGSAILVDPAMRKLQAEGAELYFTIFAKNAASLRLLGTVPEANVFTIREDSLRNLLLDTLGYLLWCRRVGIDTVIDLELFSRYSALLTGLSGAVNRVGFHAFHNEGLYRGEMLSHRVAYNPHIHIAKNFIALVNALLCERPEHPYSKSLIGDDECQLAQAEVSEAELAAMRERIRAEYPAYAPDTQRVVLINPNASELLIQRRWMPERYVEVMQRLLAEHEDLVVLITGAPAERAEAAGLVEQVGDLRCVNFAGCCKLVELPALYTLSTLMLSNDSGPGHFSAVTPLPTFVIFGPETPALYGSLGNSTPIYAGLACSPCVSAANHRKTPCHDNVCIQVITPEQVYKTLLPTLAGSE